MSGVATLALFAGLARLLSIADVGLFSAAWSFAYIVGTVTEAGYGMLAIRDVAQSPVVMPRYVGALVAIRLLLLPPALIIGVALGVLLFGTAAMLAIVLATVSSYLQLAAQTGRDFLIPSGRFALAAALGIAESVLRAACVLLAAGLTRSVVVVFLVAAAVHAFSTIATFAIVTYRIRWSEVWLGFRSWRKVGASMLTFGVFMTITALYFHVHAVLASVLLPLSAVATLQVALRLFFAAEYLPEAVARWAYPSLSRAVTSDEAKFASLASALGGSLVLVGTVIAAFLAFVAPTVVPLLFGTEYRNAVPIVQVLAVGIPLRFAAHAYGTSLSAGGRQGPRVLMAAAAMAVTIATEISLIGVYGAIGAAASVGLGAAVLVAGYFVSLRRQWASASALPPAVAFVAAAGLGMWMYIAS